MVNKINNPSYMKGEKDLFNYEYKELEIPLIGKTTYRLPIADTAPLDEENSKSLNQSNFKSSVLK